MTSVPRCALAGLQNPICIDLMAEIVGRELGRQRVAILARISPKFASTRRIVVAIAELNSSVMDMLIISFHWSSAALTGLRISSFFVSPAILAKTHLIQLILLSH